MTEAEPVDPTTGVSVGFEEHVRPLFRVKDRASMHFASDLWSYQDVSEHARDTPAAQEWHHAHFLFLERSEGMDLSDAEGFAAVENAIPMMGPDEIAPHLQEFQTVGQLYRSIEAGAATSPRSWARRILFLGPRQSEARGALRLERPLADLDRPGSRASHRGDR